MAGHSKYANIKHRKGAQDAKRSKLFSKLAREITVAAKTGKADPATIGEDANGVLQPQGRRDIDKIGGLRDAPKGQGAEEKRGVGFHGGLFCYNG